MMNVTRHLNRILAICVLFGAQAPAAGKDPSADAVVSAGFQAPVAPPRAHYRIECTVDEARREFRASEEIRFRNDSSLSISRLAFDWPFGTSDALEITIDGQPVSILNPSEQPCGNTPVLFDLPTPLGTGQEVTINCRFRLSHLGRETIPRNVRLTRWHPRLWWGLPTCDDFDVKVDAPADCAVATSGRRTADGGYDHVQGARSFGLFFGKGMEQATAMAGDIEVRCVFTPQGRECAHLLLETAVDAVRFYRERFGFYPYKSLTIVPGDEEPMGGYPVATSMVAVHGQERMSERPESHWRWITAHEIGHQYWGEYVLEKDSPGWVWIGMGIYADREYARARGLGPARHRDMMAGYTQGVTRGLDTTVARTPEQMAGVGFDFNNVVIHGKGHAIISALASVLGQEAFDRVYLRCLRQFAGRRFGAADLQAVCEAENGQDFGWFFDQWVHSNRYLCYQVKSQECRERDGRYLSEVQVERMGTLEMLVPVVARFEDGTSHLRHTDRLLKVQTMRFESSSPLKEAELDPNGDLPLIAHPASVPAKETPGVAEKIGQLPWAGAGKQALAVYQEAKADDPGDGDLWGKLGLCLYDGKHYPEALDAFRRSADLCAGKISLWTSVSFVWQGHVLDLMGRRQEALAAYRAALERDTGGTMQHGQYRMKINRAWIQKRLKEPFHREES